MAYDPSLFEARRRGLQQQYSAQSALNEYARFLSQQRGSRQVGEFQRGLVEQIPKFGRSYGKRGLYGSGIKSGIFNKALSQFGEEAARRRSEIEQGLAEQQRQYDLQGAAYQTQYEQSLADLEAEKARIIGETAAGLLGLG
jgi:hypothetical protein